MARKATVSSRSAGEKAGGDLSLDAETTSDVLARLRRVEGQVRAIARMIEERRDCHAIAHQLGAAKSALERTTVRLMTASLIDCLTRNDKGEIDRKEIAKLNDTFVKILS